MKEPVLMIFLSCTIPSFRVDTFLGRDDATLEAQDSSLDALDRVQDSASDGLKVR